MTMTPEEKLAPVSQAQPPEHLQDMADRKPNDPWKTSLRREIALIVQELAGGAYFRYTDDDVELVTYHRFDHSAFNHMLHHGWLESTAGCGGYKLSDAGLNAYLRSTDELQNVGLVDPIAEFQQ